MKIGWFSPLPPAPTDIGEYAMRLMPFLQQRATVELWSENADGKGATGTVKGAVAQALNNLDYHIYHIGNNVNMHHHTWSLSTKLPGVVVLHDTKLQHFFALAFTQRLGLPEVYADIMREYYGDNGMEAARAYLAGEVKLEALALEYPLTQLATLNAYGAIVHTAEGVRALSSLTIPVARLELPYPSHRIGDSVSKSKAGRPENRVPPITLMVFGYLSDNRCLNLILDALMTVPNSYSVNLNIAGTIPEHYSLDKEVAARRLNDRVNFLDYVSDEELDHHIRQSDLILNLRNPTMGEASGVQLRIWDNARASVVSDTGWYAELPDDAVLKITPGRERDELATIFDQLARDRDRFCEMGVRGKQYLECRHAPERYVERLIEFVEPLDVLSRPLAPRRLMVSVCDAIAPWVADNRSLSQFKAAPSEVRAFYPNYYQLNKV